MKKARVVLSKFTSQREEARSLPLGEASPAEADQNDENVEPARKSARKKTPRGASVADRRHMKRTLRELEAKLTDTEQFYREDNARTQAELSQVREQLKTSQQQVEAVIAERDAAVLQLQQAKQEIVRMKAELEEAQATKASLVKHNFRQMCASAMFDGA